METRPQMSADRIADLIAEFGARLDSSNFQISECKDTMPTLYNEVFAISSSTDSLAIGTFKAWAAYQFEYAFRNELKLLRVWKKEHDKLKWEVFTHHDRRAELKRLSLDNPVFKEYARYAKVRIECLEYLDYR